MIVYLSGGSEIAETGLKDPPIMLSWYVCCYMRKKKINARLKRAIKYRWKKGASECRSQQQTKNGLASNTKNNAGTKS